jgi:hypothetical protein
VIYFQLTRFRYTQLFYGMQPPLIPIVTYVHTIYCVCIYTSLCSSLLCRSTKPVPKDADQLYCTFRCIISSTVHSGVLSALLCIQVSYHLHYTFRFLLFVYFNTESASFLKRLLTFEVGRCALLIYDLGLR